ncbi:MAG: aldehyde dehydrogenase family protein [Terriglobales bacterium]
MASGAQPDAPASSEVQAARELIERAAAAWQSYRRFSQSQVDAVIDAMAAAATANAEPLARLAVEETTYGKVADKIQKNLFASERVYQAIRPMRTVGELSRDPERGIIEMGEPVGVVAAILPCTNPTSTAIYKILIALKAGNAIVLSPHPAAMRCICTTVDLMRQAAVRVGAPADLIGCFGTPTQEGTKVLMTHPKTRVILATGGMGIVRAAYSSGKPAFGVGPGNVPAYIDPSARLDKAVADVVKGKSFDWGTICSSEQSIVAEAGMRDAILATLRQNHVYLMNPEQAARLAALLIHPETFTVNPKCVGQSPQKLAAMAGFGDAVGADILVLAAELAGMGKQHPLSAEKLSPVLALFFMADRESAFQRASDLLHFGGLGHTCVIHAEDDAVIRAYGARMPAFRVVVNSPAPLGSIGATTNLFPAMTLGCGAVGGNSTGDNIGPQHLMNIKRIAWEVGSGRLPVASSQLPVAGSAPAAVGASCGCQHAAAAGNPTSGEEAVRRAIERVLASKGIYAVGAAPQPTFAASAAVTPAPPAPAFTPPPVAPRPKPAEFVCEADVRAADAAGRKIVLGPKTIVTPAARDLGRERGVFEE